MERKEMSVEIVVDLLVCDIIYIKLNEFKKKQLTPSLFNSSIILLTLFFTILNCVFFSFTISLFELSRCDSCMKTIVEGTSVAIFYRLKLPVSKNKSENPN